ncbi:MAG: DUF4255 domain-containing protein [Chloroflexales bacterium]|nr:DUF4255 domain-containing protein [Chloroflexales bacterium]
MFHYLDSTVRAILDDPAAPARVREAQVSFLTPDRNFTPDVLTLNLFLHEVRENMALRDPLPIVERHGSSFERRLPLLRVDCAYLVSAWSYETGAAKIVVEHELLGLALAWLSRFPTVEASYLQGGLVDQPFAPPTLVAQADARHTSELWSALGIAPRPTFSLTVTLAIDLDLVVQGPLVTGVARDYRSGDTPFETLHTLNGLVFGPAQRPVVDALVEIQDTGARATTNAAGQFHFARLPVGALTVIVRAAGYAEMSRVVPVPGRTEDYTFLLEAQG